MIFGQGAPEGTPVCCVLQPRPPAGRSRDTQFGEPVSERACPHHLLVFIPCESPVHPGQG